MPKRFLRFAERASGREAILSSIAGSKVPPTCVRSCGTRPICKNCRGNTFFVGELMGWRPGFFPQLRKFLDD
jgi:hypothetical protein